MKTILILLALGLSHNLFASSKYKKITNELDKISSSSEFLERFVLGENDQGVKILGIKFSGSSKSKSSHLVVGTHHGNETKSPILVMKFLKKLKETKGRNFQDKDIYVIPVLNIGGYNRDNRFERDSSDRSHDPNRDYPDPCISKKNFNLKSTQHLANFVRAKNIVGAITVHGYYGSLTYPWGIYTDDYKTIDHKVFEEKAKLAVKENNYTIGTHADILYPAGGAFEDWAYFELGVWSLLVELEDSPNYENDIKMLEASLKSFPNIRSLDHRHLGRCDRTKDTGISRP